jgi:hypothetical protein
MKGTLIKTEQGWVINYNYSVNKNDWETLPLYPDDAKRYQNEYDYYGAIGFKVEFEIVNIVSNKNTLSDDDNVLIGTYAKIIKSDHISDISKMVELPQQEISDDEIEKEASKYATNNGMMAYVSAEKKQAFIDSIRWYREQLKK